MYAQYEYNMRISVARPSPDENVLDVAIDRDISAMFY